MESSVLTSKGQLLIPKKIRTKYGIKPGEKIAFVETKDGVMIKPMNENYIDEIIERVGKYFPNTKEYGQWKQEEKVLEDRFLNEPIPTYKKRKSKPGSK